MCPQFAHIVYIYFGIIFNLPTHRFTYMIYQFYIHNKNLLYTAGVSSILVCRYARQVGPCSYKPKEVCNFGAPAVSTFLSGIYLVYCIPYTYITQTQNISSIRKKFLVTLAVVSSRRKGWSRAQTSIFTIENHYFWSRWLLRPAGRQARHWGCKIIVWGFALGSYDLNTGGRNNHCPQMLKV